MSSSASFLNGFANSARSAIADKKDDEQLDLYRQSLDVRREEASAMNSQRRSLPHYGPEGTYPSQNNYGAGTGGGRAGRAMKVSDPVATDLPPFARAFLNATSAGESGGAYNVRYSPEGGATFDDSAGEHPRIFEKGPHGPSSAAGRYQITATTWDELGGGAFTREAQDRKAWQLAQQRYKAYTGGDLAATLQKEGLSSNIMTTLAPTWAAFGNSGKHNDYIATYNDSYGRYSQPEPASQQASQPASAPASTPARRTIKVGQPLPKWSWANELSMGEPA